MAIIRNLGEGYYGVETKGAKIDPVVFGRINETFRSVSLIPRADISFIAYKPEDNAKEIAVASARLSAR